MVFTLAFLTKNLEVGGKIKAFTVGKWEDMNGDESLYTCPIFHILPLQHSTTDPVLMTVHPRKM